MRFLQNLKGAKSVRSFSQDMTGTMNYLNLGCGNRFNPEWVNISFTSNSPYVKAHDLRKGIPYRDEQFEVVYHSHLLEHLSKEDGIKLMDECFRVLKHGGIIRVVVPDLESIALIYLNSLQKALDGGSDWQHHYDWIMLELYDQAVRLDPGGDMLRYLKQMPIPGEPFILNRIGEEGHRIQRSVGTGTLNKPSFSANPIRVSLKPLWRLLREIFIQMLLKTEDYYALKVGRFRLQGEVHQWMYDRFSLDRLLCNAGFSEIRQRTASESYIPRWSKYQLDADHQGNIHKPDSLFVEGLKPRE